MKISALLYLIFSLALAVCGQSGTPDAISILLTDHNNVRSLAGNKILRYDESHGVIDSAATNREALIINEDTPISQIQWSGYTWNVKNGSGLGPGPNYWMGSSSSVWVDQEGNLHLKIRKVGSKWYCASISTKPLHGYGEYTFQVSTNVEKMDKNVVLGLFTYETDLREIDIEFSRWGDSSSEAGWYNVQPSSSTNHHGFDLNLTGDFSTHKYQWDASKVFFQSYFGHYDYLPEKEKLITEWTYRGSDNPPPGNERLILNLWLFRGAPPSDLKEVEVIIKSVSFKKVGDLAIHIQNFDHTFSPAPGPNGIVKLYNQENELVSSLQTDQNGTATFRGLPVGRGYYYQVFHQPNNPATLYGQEFWGSQSDIEVTEAQITNSTFTRNQPTNGMARVYDPSGEVTGQLVEPGTFLRIEQPLINPSAQAQSVMGSLLLDSDKMEPYDYQMTDNPLTFIPPNSTVTQYFTITPTEKGPYYSNGSLQTLVNTQMLITAGDTWPTLPLFTVSPSFNLELISELEQKVTQHSTANWWIHLKNSSSENQEFGLMTHKGTFFYNGKQIEITPVLSPNEELSFELRFDSEMLDIGTQGPITFSVVSNNDPNRKKSIEVNYSIIRSAIELITNDVSSITFTAATSGGTFSTDGGTTISAKGICWGTSPYPTVFLVTKTSEGTGNDSFSSNMIDLTHGTTYHVRAYAINETGVVYGNDVAFKTSVFNPPVAKYYARPVSGCNPLTVHFTDQSSATPSSWAWDVDNNGSIDYTIQDPTHTYEEAGTYSVKLTVTNTSGSDTKTITDYITVQPMVVPAVNISALPSAKIEAGQLVTFTANPVNGGTTPTYQWTVDGIITANTGSTFASTGLTNGQMVSCQMTSSELCSDPQVVNSNTVTLEVRPLNGIPLADAGSNQSVGEGALVTLDGTSSTDPDSDPLTYLWIAPTGITLSSMTQPKPTFTAPSVKKDTFYNFSLIVNDGMVNSLPSSVKISVVKGIKTSAKVLPEEEIKIYPNPASGLFKLEGMKSGEKTAIEVYTMDGRLIMKAFSHSGNYEIDISQQASGPYLVKVNQLKILIVKE